MATVVLEENKKYRKIINNLAIAIPVAVAVLIGIRQKIDLGAWTKVLPHVIGMLNTATAILLILGFYFIKTNNRSAHRLMMTVAFILGAVFLVCYILYHISNESTPFGGSGFIRPIYYFLLIFFF